MKANGETAAQISKKHIPEPRLVLVPVFRKTRRGLDFVIDYLYSLMLTVSFTAFLDTPDGHQ